MTSASHDAANNTAPSPVWLVRAGAKGEDEALALELNLAVIGFTEIPDLTGVSNREAVLERVQSVSPDARPNRIRNRAGQLNAFVLRMKEGDIVALPFKTRPGHIALGCVSGEYRYERIEGVMRHTRPVDWIRPDVPRSEFGQDLLYSLGAFLTVCRIKRNNAENRIAAILARSRDHYRAESNEHQRPADVDLELEPDDEAAPDITQIARDQIFEHIRSRFPGHEFAQLVEAVLQAEGYFTLLSPPGPDGGVDILAGSGPLGFESPKLCVQVKATANAVDVTVLRSLRGTMQSFNSDQGLLVSWGGFTRDLEREARQSFFTVRLWGADDFVDAICRNYERLPEQIQNDIPLERVWTLVRDDSEY